MKQVIDSNRMFSLLANDSYSNPEKIIPILKAEIKEVLDEYLILKGDLKVRYKFTDDGLIFMIEVSANSIKNVFRCN